jgi:hypothetical protein
MKHRLMQAGAVTATLSICLCLFPAKTYAYVDPTAGSSILQLLFAGLLGVLYAAKLYWTRFKSFFAERGNAGRQPERKD